MRTNETSSSLSSLRVLLALLTAFAGACASGDPDDGGDDSGRVVETGDGDGDGADRGDAGAPSGPDFGNTDSQPAGIGSDAGPVSPNLDPTTCARAQLLVERIVPRVVFLVDASSSMRDDFGGISRWDALREALIEDGGLVPTLADIVKFGLITYEGPRFTTCPAYSYAAPAPGNLQYVDAAFPAEPPLESSTPTGIAMDWAIDNAFLDQRDSPDVEREAQYMIFATDGEPNGCSLGGVQEPARDFNSVLSAAEKAAAREIDIFVISLAEASGEFAEHLVEVAQIGGTDAVFSPSSKADLVGELQQIIGAAVSCEVELDGRVRPGMECLGEVTLNGDPLECNGADGWELVDESHVLLHGQACDDFKLIPTALVGAEFPCMALQ